MHLAASQSNVQALSGKAEEVGDQLVIVSRYPNPQVKPSHFGVKGLYILPLKGPEKGWHMAKIDLKDAYLAIIILITQEHQCPMSTPIGGEEWNSV